MNLRCKSPIIRYISHAAKSPQLTWGRANASITLLCECSQCEGDNLDAVTRILSCRDFSPKVQNLAASQYSEHRMNCLVAPASRQRFCSPSEDKNRRQDAGATKLGSYVKHMFWVPLMHFGDVTNDSLSSWARWLYGRSLRVERLHAVVPESHAESAGPDRLASPELVCL